MENTLWILRGKHLVFARFTSRVVRRYWVEQAQSICLHVFCTQSRGLVFSKIYCSQSPRKGLLNGNFVYCNWLFYSGLSLFHRLYASNYFAFYMRFLNAEPAVCFFCECEEGFRLLGRWFEIPFVYKVSCVLKVAVESKPAFVFSFQRIRGGCFWERCASALLLLLNAK